jgi:hypothetical protein
VFNAMTMTPGGFTDPSSGTVTTNPADQVATAPDPQNVVQPDGAATPQLLAGQPGMPALAASDAPGPDTWAIGAMPPTDAQAVHDAVLTGWASSGPASPEGGAAGSVDVIVPATSPTGLVPGQAGTPVIQGDLVDSVIDGLGSLSSLLGSENEIVSSPFSKPRGSNA